MQRKVLTANDFATLAAPECYLLAFQHRYSGSGATIPLDLYTTRADLHQVLAKLAAVRPSA